MNKLLLLSLITVGMLTGCNNSLSPMNAAGNEGTSDNSSNSVQEVQPQSEAQKMLADLEATLKANAVSASPTRSKMQAKLNLPALNLDLSQISSIMGSANASVTNAGLINSNDISAILPVLIGGASQGVGGLGLPTNQVSSLMGLIGNGSLTSVLGSSGVLGGATGGAIPTDLVSLLSGSLFQNLPTAGIPTNGLPSASGNLMGLLLGNLGSTGLGSGGLSSIISSISSGAVTGVGGLQIPGMNSNLLSGILGQIGAGSVTGIGGISIPGLGGGMNANLIQTLLGSFTSGAGLGLGQIGGGQGMGGNLISTLLGSVTQGQTGALPGLGLGLGQTQGMAGFLQLLMGSFGGN